MILKEDKLASFNYRLTILYKYSENCQIFMFMMLKVLINLLLTIQLPDDFDNDDDTNGESQNVDYISL